jgi:hypothetical protein
LRMCRLLVTAAVALAPGGERGHGRFGDRRIGGGGS